MIKEKLQEKPLVLDMIPLTLEEIFIYEMEDLDMTALTLSNGFKSNYILKLKSNKKFTMVGFVMNLLSAPLF